jgi:hypothetical protein
MDGRVRNPYLEKSYARKNKTVYLLYDQTKWNNNNHQSQNQNARMTRVMGSRGV